MQRTSKYRIIFWRGDMRKRDVCHFFNKNELNYYIRNMIDLGYSLDIECLN